MDSCGTYIGKAVLGNAALLKKDTASTVVKTAGKLLEKAQAAIDLRLSRSRAFIG
jgi:hypothetical protein